MALVDGKAQTGTPVNVGLVGTGMFGRSFLAQAGRVPNMRVVAVCDQDGAAALSACRLLGKGENLAQFCDSTGAARDVIARGGVAVVEDGTLLAELPLDVLVEATGVPEAGAIHARSAISAGKHVVMVTKETDSVIGPILARMAAAAGVVYSSGDGDQPSLLVHLVRWAEGLGFEIACAGKASESDTIFDEASGVVRHGEVQTALGDATLWRIGDRDTVETVMARQQAWRDLPQKSVAALCEMAMVMNATGYGWDTPALHAPIVRTPEIADVLCSRDEGGILAREGVIDVVNCLRRPDEASFAGGVFVVLKAEDAETWQMLKRKGHVVNRRGTRAMIYRPHHLLGVEIATTILAAAEGKSVWRDVQPRADLCARTTKPLVAGQMLTMLHDHSIPELAAEIRPASRTGAGEAVPFYLAAGRRVRRDVAAGELLTWDMVDVDESSVLAQLRREQDRLLG